MQQFESHYYSLYCKPFHLPVLTGNNGLQCSIFKKPVINCKDNKNQTLLSTEFTKWRPQASPDRICTMHSCRVTTWHVCVCVCVFDVCGTIHTPVIPSAPAPAPAPRLSPKQSFSLYGHGHCLIPRTVPPTLPLLKPKHSVCYGRRRLFKKYWEKKERPSRRLIWF